MILQIAATAVSVGLGCGTCCSPSVSVFLSTYIMSHAGGMKKSVLSYLSFFIGKILAVALLCTVSSLIGYQFIDDSGFIGIIDLSFVLQIIMIAVGVFLTVKWFYSRKRKTNECKSCKGCSGGNIIVPKKAHRGYLPLVTVGFTYGISPCAPLLMIVGYAATLSIAGASIIGTVFAIASSLTPILLLVLLSGALSGKMAQEIPQYLEWFRLVCYILLIVFSFAAIL